MPPTYSLNPEIRYEPSSALISYDWDHPAQLLQHLLVFHNERDFLRNQARKESNGCPRFFTVHHSLLGDQLSVHSYDSDQQFTVRIKQLIPTVERPAPRVPATFTLADLQHPFTSPPPQSQTCTSPPPTKPKRGRPPKPKTLDRLRPIRRKKE